MSIPFGKMKKSSQQNIQCFLASVEAYINDTKGEDFNKNARKKYDKYIARVIDITGGKFK